MGLAVLDASVLIALYDASDAHHDRARDELNAAQGRHTLALPAAAFSEALVQPYRQGPAKGRAIEDSMRGLGRVEPVTDRIASRAAQLRARCRIKLPDALIIATGQELRAAETLTFDERWASIDSRVRVL